MDVASFIAKWTRTELSERAASQEHFLDVCRLLGQPTPAEHDATGAEYTFEKGVTVAGPASKGTKGDRGFADAWWKGKFGWEYKRKGKYADLGDAYRQLCQYREALANPPLLVVSDIARTEIHTNFTGFRSEVHVVELARLHEAGQLDILRRVFTNPLSFQPEQTAEQVTERAAKEIGAIAQGLRERGHDPHDAAHFLVKVMFCLFAEDVELLPHGLFERLLKKSKYQPARLKAQMDALFAAMRTGDDFGIDEIAYFDGGLFDGSEAIELTDIEIQALVRAAEQDWGSVEPSVFGTLFERSLDPAKRSQIGAHYTSREDIMLVIEPVIVRPLRREWEETKVKIEQQIERRRRATTTVTKKKADTAIGGLLDDFLGRLSAVRVLDPACGSGNFLYVAIQQLLSLEKEVILYAARPEIGAGILPRVRPTQLFGIEINLYAVELAQVVIWIGYLQWMRDNGFNPPRNPILEPIETIEHRDAILEWESLDGKRIPVWRDGAICRGPADWPDTDFVVGNPPFLGSKLFRRFGLPESYIAEMYHHFDLPNTSDLCCYWFELARSAIESRPTIRAGLLATQAIRGQFNRKVMDRIMASTPVFDAWADREWILEGAAVQVSIVCFGGHAESPLHLDGQPVSNINANLSDGVDLTSARKLPGMDGIAFMGNTKGGDFDVDWVKARRFLAAPNPHGLSNFDVVRPWVNGMDLTGHNRCKWLIDFGTDRDRSKVSCYELPFRHTEVHVRPERETNRRVSYAKYWWIHAEPRPAMRAALAGRGYTATPNLTKYRFFVKLHGYVVPDHQLIIFTRTDDYFFGLLQSSIHELWARQQGTQLREAESGFRYTPTTCFATFPLPWPPDSEPAENDRERPYRDAIAKVARALDDRRGRWLNPPEWIAEIAKEIDAADDFADVAAVSGGDAQRLIRHAAITAQSIEDERFKKRTLTNLYNERPTWLRLATNPSTKQFSPHTPRLILRAAGLLTGLTSSWRRGPGSPSPTLRTTRRTRSPSGAMRLSKQSSPTCCA